MARRTTAQKKAKPQAKGKLVAFEKKHQGQQKEPKPPFPNSTSRTRALKPG
jgi:hypothetical protein